MIFSIYIIQSLLEEKDKRKWVCGAIVVRLTPNQRVACSIHVRFIPRYRPDQNVVCSIHVQFISRDEDFVLCVKLWPLFCVSEVVRLT